jgi:predicted RecA/RadA family phage recombinase
MGEAKFVQTGETITHPISAAVAEGDVIVIGQLVGVVVRDVSTADVALGREAEVRIDGVYDMPKVGSLVVAAGDAMYWDEDGTPYGGSGTGAVTKTAAAGNFCGFAIEAAGSNVTPVKVKLAAKDSYDLT